MNTRDIEKDELISAVRGINLLDFSVKELEFLADLFKIKERQIETEIRKRKAEGRD